MAGFFGKLFGKKKAQDSYVEFAEDVLHTIIETGYFSLSFDINCDENSKHLKIELFGDDEEMLKAKEGQVLDSIQLYLKIAIQHNFPEERVSVSIDCAGFREESNQSLIDLAEKLKGIAMHKGKPVYFRALPPRDRKVIHQYLAEDGRVKSRSVGDGLYKKIKIYPAKNEQQRNAPAERTV